MAKQYAAELLLKHKNLIQSLDQAIKKTKELKKQLEKPIEVDAKLGSSFKNIESRINKITPKEKVIKITATEDVTKTMNNVQRNMFEMSNKINSSLTSSMKGFNASISGTLPKLQAMSNTMAAVANTSKLASSIAHAATASGLAGTGAGLAGAAVLGGKGKYSNKGKTNISKKEAKLIYDYLNPSGLKGIFNSGRFSKINKDVLDHLKLTNKELKKYGSLGLDDEEENKIIDDFIKSQYSNPKNLRAIDDSFADIIDRQKQNMEKLGKSNYLAKYQRIVANNTNYGMFNVKNANKDISRIKKVQDKWSKAIKQMNQNAKFGLAYALYPLQQKATKVFNAVKRTGLSAWYTLERGVFKVGQSVGVIEKAFSDIAPNIMKAANKIPEFFTRAFTKVEKDSDGNAKRVKRDWVVQMQQVSSKIVNVLGKAFNKIASMGKWAAGAVAGAFGVGLADMANQEQYITSMSHFISVDDAKRNGKNTITKDQAKQRAEGLFDWGTKFANSTPFQNDEVYSAINRMTQVFGYGTDGAQIQKMVKLVGDMAA